MCQCGLRADTQVSITMNASRSMMGGVCVLAATLANWDSSPCCCLRCQLRIGMGVVSSGHRVMRWWEVFKLSVKNQESGHVVPGERQQPYLRTGLRWKAGYLRTISSTRYWVPWFVLFPFRWLFINNFTSRNNKEEGQCVATSCWQHSVLCNSARRIRKGTS